MYLHFPPLRKANSILIQIECCIPLGASPKRSGTQTLSQTRFFHFYNPHCISVLQIESCAAPSSSTPLKQLMLSSNASPFYSRVLWLKDGVGIRTTSMMTYDKSTRPIQEAFWMLSFSLISPHPTPNFPVWKIWYINWNVWWVQFPPRPIASSACGSVCLCVYFWHKHRMDWLSPSPWPVANTYTSFESLGDDVKGDDQGRHQTHLFWILNYDFLSSIFWLHCYTKDKVTSGLRSLLWRLWDQWHFLGLRILCPSNSQLDFDNIVEQSAKTRRICRSAPRVARQYR